MRISDWSSDVCSSDLAIRSPGVSPRITKPAYKRPLEVDGEFLITGFSAVTLQIPKQTSSNAIAFFHSRMLSSRKIADSTEPNTGIRKLKTVTQPHGMYRSEEPRVGEEVGSTVNIRW